MKAMSYSLIILISLLFSCKKEIPQPPDPCTNPPCNTDTLPKEILWQLPSQPDSSTCLSNYPLIYNNEVIFTKFLCEYGVPVFFIDKTTGKQIDYNYDVKMGSTAENLSQYIYSNYYVVHNWHYTYIFDLEQHKLIKTWNIRDFGAEGEPRTNGIAYWMFQGWSTQAGVGKNYFSSSMVRRNIITSAFDTICTIKSDECYTPTLEAPAFWITPQNDTVIIFHNGQYRFGGNPCKMPAGYRTDLYAYNITKDKMEWTAQDIAITKQASVHLPVIFDNKVFFQGANEVFVFDCFTGQLIWSRYFPGEGFFNTNAVLAEGKFILKSESDRMIAVDASTGATVWDNPTAGHSNTNMIYYKGKVYYETGQNGLGVIRALRVNDGVVTWTWFPNNYPKFSNVSYGLCGIAIDQQTGLLYTHDRRFMQCIRIPE